MILAGLDLWAARALRTWDDSNSDHQRAQHLIVNALWVLKGLVQVNNNCSTGSTALFLAHQMVQAGVSECT